VDNERDDGRRAKEGVVVCLRDLGNGSSRLIFDDVVAESENNPTAWRFGTFFTWNTYANAELDKMNLSDDQFQRLGEALVARLLAISRRGE
jgi:hypothetical protein